MEQPYTSAEKCFVEALVCIREALGARRIHVQKDGTRIDAGPDHYAVRSGLSLGPREA